MKRLNSLNFIFNSFNIFNILSFNSNLQADLFKILSKEKYSKLIDLGLIRFRIN